MDEYIKKQDVIGLIMSQPVDAHYPSWYADLVDKISVADVVPVVRCKDCQYAVEAWSGSVNYCMLSHMPIRPVDFLQLWREKGRRRRIMAKYFRITEIDATTFECMTGYELDCLQEVMFANDGNVYVAVDEDRKGYIDVDLEMFDIDRGADNADEGAADG